MFLCFDLSLWPFSILIEYHWPALHYFPNSDHFLVLSPTLHVPLPNPSRYSFDRSVWHTFSLNISLPPPLFSSDLLLFFTVTVQSAAFTAIPQTSRLYTSKCVPLWNFVAPRLHVSVEACSLEQISLQVRHPKLVTITFIEKSTRLSPPHNTECITICRWNRFLHCHYIFFCCLASHP